jgi:cysteine desulfurase
MAPFLNTHFGNPSSSHAFATPCKEALRLARAQVAALVNADPEEILCVFFGAPRDNGGGTCPCQIEKD